MAADGRIAMVQLLLFKFAMLKSKDSSMITFPISTVIVTGL